MKINSENLYELINDGTIKVNTKIKVYEDDIYRTTITFDGYDFIWETGTFSSEMLFNPLVDFEIIEEEKEIEELDLGKVSPNGEYIISVYDEKIQNKINELVREVNKLKNK